MCTFCQKVYEVSRGVPLRSDVNKYFTMEGFQFEFMTKPLGVFLRNTILDDYLEIFNCPLCGANLNKLIVGDREDKMQTTKSRLNKIQHKKNKWLEYYEQYKISPNTFGDFIKNKIKEYKDKEAELKNALRQRKA